MSCIAIIADDLTGANDTGVQFCHHGLDAMVIINTKLIDYHHQKGKVLAVNTNTRSMQPEDAYHAVYNIGVSLRDHDIAYLYKKIDSTLRGHPGVELEALMDVWQVPLGLVVPSFPANGRIVHKGKLYIHKQIPSTDIELPGDALCDIPQILQQQMKRKVGLIELDIVRKGPVQLFQAWQDAQKEYNVLVVDAVTDQDLENIAYAMKYSFPKVMAAGSAGLASYLDLVWDLKGKKKKQSLQKFPEHGVTIFIAGSRNVVTARQINELSQISQCQPVVLNPSNLQDLQKRAQETERVIKDVFHNLCYTNTVIITVGEDVVVCEDSRKIGKIIGETLGEIIGNLSLKLNLKGLVIVGGDTALNICNALEVEGINLVTELQNGIPFGYLSGKRLDGLPIVTKAGGFGSPDALVRIYHLFNNFEICKEVGTR